MKILVSEPFLPPKDEYQKYIDRIYNNKILTNQGPILKELETKLGEYLSGARYIHCVSNGTTALQLATNSLGITDGEIITTPFSYIATISSILWERCKPVFVDIEKDNFTIDSNKIEEAIDNKTKAILGVHVFGYKCNTEKIAEIAKKYNIKVIYDGAHAFGCKYKNKSLLSYGDITAVSFHATKVFHTIEGGACITNSKKLSNILEIKKKFGNNEIFGINAKMSEFQAGMGLANLTHLENILLKRKNLTEMYDNLLNGKFERPKAQNDLQYNFAYYPILFETEKELLKAFKALNEKNIFPRRYFYPSLNTLKYIKYQQCPISEDISCRIACLPLHNNLNINDVETIIKILKKI